MKKIFITILALGITVGAFAQLRPQLTVDINPNFLVATTPVGSNATDENDPNYLGSGTFDLFTPYRGYVGQENQLRFALNYSRENLAAYVRLNGDNLIRFGQDQGQMVTGNGQVNLGDLWNGSLVRFDEWFFRGTVGIFTGYVGNTADRGRVNRFQNFEDFAIRPVKFDNYGVNTPNAGGFNIDDTVLNRNFLRDFDNNNFQRVQRLSSDTNPADHEFVRADQAYFSLSADFAPFTVQAALDVGNNSGIAATHSRFRANGGFRVSGNRIADTVTFDAIYRFRGGDPTTDDSGSENIGTAPDFGTNQPDGRGESVHSFGVYANLFVVDNLGIGLGYTGLVRAYEDVSDSVSRTGPYFNGIDLRFQFTGVDRFRFTLNNNISFSVVNGDSGNTVYGVLGSGNLNDNQSESWFALYNALGVDYSLTDALTLSAQLANGLGIYTQDDDGSETEIIRNRFIAALFASYAFTNNVTLQGGLRFDVNTAALSNSQSDVELGRFGFAIPVRLRLVY